MRRHASPDEIAFLAQRAGLDLAPEHLADLVEAYGHLEAMLERLPKDWPTSAEPAHVFAPLTFMPQRDSSR